MGHQSADKIHLTAQAVQLGDVDRTLAPLGLVQRGGESRRTRQRVVPLAGLDLGKLRVMSVALTSSRPCPVFPLTADI